MRDFRRLTIITAALASMSSALMGCQTPRYRSFDGVKSGMTKAEVIDETGGPDRVVRMDGKDRWIYVFRDHPEGPQIREVHFDAGLATYVGNQVFPKVSAKDQDKKNEASNQAEARRLEEEEQQAAALMGKARASGSTAQASSPEQDAVDKYIQDSLYGNSDLNAEKSKRAPVFVPVDE